MTDSVRAVRTSRYRHLYIEFKEGPVAETRDLDENTVLDIDPDGRITAITVEHASERTGIPQFSYEQIAA